MTRGTRRPREGRRGTRWWREDEPWGNVEVQEGSTGVEMGGKFQELFRYIERVGMRDGIENGGLFRNIVLK